MTNHNGVRTRASKAVRAAAVASVAGAAITIPLASAGSASAAPVSTWDAVAQCESGGNWHIDTGNGYYGGLQFSRSSWDGAGGTAYASRADLATKDQQIAVAQKLLAQQGPGAWSCASAGGLTSGGPAPDVHPATAGHAPAHPERTPAGPIARGDGGYTVRQGDTLSRIALRHHVAGGWHRLFELNQGVVKDAGRIFPGQRLHLS
jgi:resuscitation-promoting factor RpfA